MWNLILLWVMSINSLNVPTWVWALAWIEIIIRFAIECVKDSKRW